jgi:hypothetical protein
LPAVLALGVTATQLQGQSQYVTPDGVGDITFTPGLRIQARYLYNQEDGNNDIFIRRLRLKGSGELFGLATYYAEVKIDNVGRFAFVPRAQVENAWLQFPVVPHLNLRVGLYDAVFSRDALTSDSKLLLMNRSLIKGALTVLGLADNAVGLLVHGRPLGGHLEYSAGLFDNVGFEISADEIGSFAREADGLMPMGRVVFHALDPAPAGGYADYRGSYIGQGRRLSIGANAAYLSKARINEAQFDLYAWGADLFFNYGPLSLQAEYDRYTEDLPQGTPDINGDGWYAQGGYLFLQRFEVTARHEQLDPDSTDPDDGLKWTAVGINLYIREHNLKIQSDYTWREERGENRLSNNVFQLQLQVDF